MVEIVNINLLTQTIERASGECVRYGSVKYTDGIERSHFMKSVKDSWMKEFRIRVPRKAGSDSLNVVLPKGIAVLKEI